MGLMGTIILWPCILVSHWLLFVLGIVLVYFTINNSFPTSWIVIAIFLTIITISVNYAVIGTLTNWYTLFVIYISITSIMKIGILLYVIINKNSIETKILDNWLKINTQNFNLQKNDLHLYQIEEHCCGINSYKDWLNKLQKIPGSCCRLPIEKTCNQSSTESKYGCIRMYKMKIDRGLFVIKFFIFITTLLEILFVISFIIFLFVLTQHDPEASVTEENEIS